MTINNLTVSTSSLMSESSGGTSLRSKAGYSSRKVPNSASSRARSTQSGNTTALSSLDDLAESAHVSQDPLRDAINEDSSTNLLDRKRDIERNADETIEGRATRSPHYPEDDRSTWVQRSGKAIGGGSLIREIRSGGNRIRSASHKLAAVTSVSRAVLGKEKTVVKEARDIEKSIQEVIKAVEKVGSSIVRTNVELSEPEKREYKNGSNLQRLTGSNHSTERFSLRKTKEQASKHVVNRRNPLYGFLIESKQIDDFFTSVLGYIEVYLAFIDLQSNRFKTINDRTRGLNIQYLPERVVAYLFEAAVDADIHRSSHNSQKPTLGSSVSSTSLQNASSPKSAKSRDTMPFASTASEQSDNDRKRALKEVGLRYSLLLLYGHHLLSDTNLIRDLEKKRSTAVLGPKSHFPPSKKEITKDWNIRPKTAPAKLEAGDTSSIERDCFEQVYAIAEEIVRLRFFPFVMQKAPSPLWKCVRIELDRIFRGRFFSAKAAEVDVQVNPETAYSTSNYLEPSEKTDIMLAERGARRASEASLKWTELANRPATAPVKAQGIRGVGINIRPSSGGLRGNRMKLSIFRVVDSRSDASISLLPKQTGRQFALASSPAGKSTKSIISTHHVGS